MTLFLSDRNAAMSDLLLPLDVNPFPGVVFVDCEASALERPSYPIEVGLAWCDGRSRGHLVRPVEAWDDWAWNLRSAEIHKIPRQDLFRHGTEVEVIAEWLNSEFEGKIVCSDNPSYEAYWLTELFTAADVRPQFMIHDSRSLITSALSKRRGGLRSFDDIEQRVKAAAPITHRAADDALFWALFFREASLFAAAGPQNESANFLC